MDIRTSSFDYPPARGERQTAAETVQFPRSVREVGVGITGYAVSFDGSDHHLGRLEVEVAASVDATDETKVSVTGRFQLRDWSGDLDDRFAGNVQWALFADLVPAPVPEPGEARTDLLVVAAETTQVTQHFRSATHLAPPNVLPDNSVRLVADKPTVIRLYVDYDPDSGLPVIDRLSGTLEVRSPAGTRTLPPLETIRPRRDAATDRGVRAHTLNFRIPDELCTGRVSFHAQVHDVADVSAFSAAFERELRFEDRPELRIQAVGVEYTGDDVDEGATAADLAAPSEADFVDVFRFTENVYPVPEVVIDTYQTIEYDKPVRSNIGNGCDKLQGLRDAVADLRGDSGAIVYGLFNSGLDTGTVGGCGGGGVGVGVIGGQGTAAHEVGHALGRQHAPCDNVTRCEDPHNQDSSYPDYAGFDSDSIGEYGFDVVASSGRVKSPADFHDFMGYSPGEWISPYTYKALMSAMPVAGAAAAATLRRKDRGADRAEWRPARSQRLFVRIDMEPDGPLTVHEAFHYPSLPQPRGGKKTDLAIELRDADCTLLIRECLYAEGADDCGCGCAGVIRVRQAVPFDAAATQLRIVDGSDVRHEQDIGRPPAVDVKVDGAQDPDRDDIEVTWGASDCDDDSAVWFLVQWGDGWGVWRGVAPRTTATSLTIPKACFGAWRLVGLRVLATTGVATGSGEWRGAIVRRPRKPWEHRAGLAGVPTGRTVEVGPRLKGVTAEPAADLRWYADGLEIGRTRTVDLRALPHGTTRLSVMGHDRGFGVARGSWLVHHDEDGTFRVLSGDDAGE